MSRKISSELPAIGVPIQINTKSYDRIYGMILGIRASVSNSSVYLNRTQESISKFEYVERIRLPREGNQISPPHSGNYDYRFKTYAPVPFQELRLFFGIADQEFLSYFTADCNFSELKSIGRSAAMFYFSWNGRFIIKTLTKSEMKVLRYILPSYYEHILTHPNTFCNQFYGAYSSSTSAGNAIRFVVMSNVFPVGMKLNLKFDLKGSTINRMCSEEEKNTPGSTWKEDEFKDQHFLKIGPANWPRFRNNLKSDLDFLSKVGVMDYSLLIGVHYFHQASPFFHPLPGEKVELFFLIYS